MFTKPGNVHYSDAGSKKLAEQVAELVDAADEDDLRHVIEEAADVHNFLVALVHQAIARYRGRKKNEN